jgi:hypothetical protein
MHGGRGLLTPASGIVNRAEADEDNGTGWICLEQDDDGFGFGSGGEKIQPTTKSIQV